MSLELDKNFNIRKSGLPVKAILWRVVWIVASSISLAILYYSLFATFMSTDTEKALSAENKAYEQAYERMAYKQALVEDVFAGLQVKDEMLYQDIFHTSAPALDPTAISGTIVDRADSLKEKQLIRYSVEHMDAIDEKIEGLAENIQRILDAYKRSVGKLPPTSIPIRDISYIQIGASKGRKLNPFYKIDMDHKGVDIIAPQGEEVLATADGVVRNVTKSTKLDGNVVEIEHAGGFVTRYCHLGDMYVRKGQNVKHGQVLGLVGMSGNSYAPHLHYEIHRGDEVLDPVSYFFASVSTKDYSNMLYMARITNQSLD